MDEKVNADVSEDLRRGKTFKRGFFSKDKRLKLNQRIDMDCIFIIFDRKDRWLQLRINLTDGGWKSLYGFAVGSSELKRKISRELIAYHIWLHPGEDFRINGSLDTKEWFWLAAREAGIDVSTFQPTEKRRRELLGK